MMGNHWWSRSAEGLLRGLGISYELRIRLTLAFMFLLIVVATVNSVRYFRIVESTQQEKFRQETVRRLELIAADLRVSPQARIQSRQIELLTQASGMRRLQLVETEALRSLEADSSAFLDSFNLAAVQRAFALPKEVAGGDLRRLPSSITDVSREPDGTEVRYAFFHFVDDAGTPLTLSAVLPAAGYTELTRLTRLNISFQIVAVMAALSIALILLRITLKPYRQIKEEAVAAKIARSEENESVDFALETFQRVIAELRRKEEKLQRLYAQQKVKAADLERYNEYVLETMPSGVVSVNLEGIVTGFNRAASTILGIRSADALNRAADELFAPHQLLRQMFIWALSEGKEVTLPETEISVSADRKVWLSLSCLLLRDQQSQLRGAMLFMTDLTEIKLLEREMAAKEQLAALGEMAAGLAHQLRNAMGAVIGFAQLLSKLPSDDERPHQIANSILSEARTTEEMLGRFLSLSRSTTLRLSQISWQQLNYELRNHFDRQLRDRKIRLKFIREQALFPLRADHLLLFNALVNLIQNAIHASRERDTVTVRVENADRDQLLVITVSDCGVGMTDEQLANMFTPFYTSGKAEGTGLGLTLARKWIMQHGGSIHCHSQKGKGTTFTIVLPSGGNEGKLPQESAANSVANASN